MIQKIKWLFFTLFVIGNIIAYNHAYSFTHFAGEEKTLKPELLTISQKIKVLLFGVQIPKAKNTQVPQRDYSTITLNSHEQLEAWYIKVKNAKGTVILFHGYSGEKSSMLRYAEQFNQKGYSSLLVDFMGCGNSSGYTTTIGFKESRDVKEAFNYIENIGEQKIILFGVSMGAVAITKALKDYDISPNKVILECPFGSMLSTTKMRFEAMNIPSFPFSEILLFYGGLQNQFNPFTHNPKEYVKHIQTPTLLHYGKNDSRIMHIEIKELYNNIPSNKRLTVMQNSAHEIYLNKDSTLWNKSIDAFLAL